MSDFDTLFYFIYCILTSCQLQGDIQLTPSLLINLKMLYLSHLIPIVPSVNVATILCGASVIEGVSRSRNALLNGDTSNYDWDSGYTCHQLGSGAIVIQLAQPYMLGSLR